MKWTLWDGSSRSHRTFSARRRLCAAAPWLGLLTAAVASLAAAEVTIVDGATTIRRAPRDRGPRGSDGSGADASGLRNADFSSGLEGWDATESGGAALPGGVAAEGGEAVLREGDSFLVTLSQGFAIEPGAGTLSFAVRLEPGFDLDDASIPDAFEASLLAEGGGSVVATWSAEATSFLNFQETGTILAGPGGAWDGERATVDISAVAEGRAVTLYFDLIGADGDPEGAVRVDDIRIAPRAREGFIRGNPDLDDAINITDPIVILNYLFLGTSALACLDAADVDDDGDLNITDPIYLLRYLFLGALPPPAPFPTCGPDGTEDDDLDCGPCSCPEAAGGDCP